MIEKSVDLLLYLRQNKSLKSSTIDSLIECGFDSNDSLIALDFKIDLPQIKNINFGQKSLLRKLLTQFKGFNNNKDFVSNNKCLNECESHSIVAKIKSFFELNNDSTVDQLTQNLQNIAKQKSEKELIINRLEKELENKDLIIDKLNEDLKRTQNQFIFAKNTIKSLESQLKTKSFSGLRNYLLSNSRVNSGLNSCQNFGDQENEVLVNSLDQTSSDSHLNQTFAELTQNLVNFESEVLLRDCETNSYHNSRPEESETSIVELDTTSSVSHLDESVSELNKSYLNFDSEVENIICEPIICFEDNPQNNSESEEVIENRISNNNQKRYYCKHSECDKSFAKLYGLQRHIRSIHSKEKPFKCCFDECDKAFGRRDALKLHIKRFHSKEKKSLFECHHKDCNQKFRSKSSFITHVNKHSGFKRYKCHYFECDKSFDDLNNFKRHINSVHTKQNLFKCHFNNCGKSFVRNDYLKVHIKRFHLKERTLECDFQDCDKSFSTKLQLEDHKKRHLGLKKFKCNSSECHKSFVTLKELKRHTNYVHNNNKLFNCNLNNCNQSFVTNDSLVAHLQSCHRLTRNKNFEVKEKPFECNYENCGKKFALKTVLNKHILIHSSLKQFKCSFNDCFKSFRNSFSLQRHERTVHTKEKPFKCTFGQCLKAFGRKDSLKEHIKTHSRINS
jgi:uncharacterized Zn-finger protein